MTSVYHVEEGDVDEDIVDFAETSDVAPIVVAAHGRTGIDRFVQGSNTERAVRWVPYPLPTVPSVLEEGGRRRR